MGRRWQPNLGAVYLGGGRCRFRVWAPSLQKVDVHLAAPRERLVAMKADRWGYHESVVDDVEPGVLYWYRLDDNTDRPDPASRSQPQGVHGPSEVVDSQFDWHDAPWRGLPLPEYLIYELHVGTFTPEGTFEAAIGALDGLSHLGVTAIELMPVAQFPGTRNWGYDGAYPYAVQNSYGGPQGLKRLVDECHQRGLAVVLDVVYNHVGPEGNYLGDFAPYFTSRYRTPWGAALNFDGPRSDEVRRFFIENALHWVTEYHVDALRLDALHAILDISARPFIAELATDVHQQAERLQRQVYLIGESAANEARLIRPPQSGGYGLDSQWNEDFHHSLHALLSGEAFGYYQDFGEVHHLAKAFREGFVYSGEYSAYCQRRHGSSSRDIPAPRFVVFAQNHDQVGNRMNGERLAQLVSPEALKVAAGAVLLSPFVPLLFMGEEYGETAPFRYFVSHSDPQLVESVQRGRREEFAAFQWHGEPPDPQDEKTFLDSKTDSKLRCQGDHLLLLDFYRELIRLRKTTPALAHLSKENLEVAAHDAAKTLFLRRWSEDSEAVIVFNFADAPTRSAFPVPRGRWHRLLDSAEERWGGGGTSVPQDVVSHGETALGLHPHSFVVLTRAREA